MNVIRRKEKTLAYFVIDDEINVLNPVSGTDPCLKTIM